VIEVLQAFASTRRSWNRLRIASALWAGFLSVCVAGCATMPPFKPSGRPVSDSNLCGRVLTNRANVTSLRSLVEATLRPSYSESVSFRYAIASKEPEQLRIDVLPLEGAYTLGMIVVRPEGATVIDTHEQTYSQAADADELLERFLGLRGVTPAVVKALLTREVPLLQCADVTAYGSPDGAITLVDARHHVAWILEGDSKRIHAVELLDSLNEKIEARAEILGRAETTPEIHFSIYAPTQATAQMVVRKLTLQKEIPDTLFDVAIPSGYRRVE
jgi:hypothetical protein